MQKLPNELLLLIGYNLDFKSILSFLSINKNNFQIYDLNFFENLAYKYYGKEFWEKANKRPLYSSNLLTNYKLELIRIENFQQNLDNLNINRWRKKDFYNYWKYRDEYLKIENIYNL
tara:strand:- start:263 stop:613 length:351 start_codon:yes stop_codon:yes gene_type:complete